MFVNSTCEKNVDNTADSASVGLNNNLRLKTPATRKQKKTKH